jgi:magnesium-transporting ATPase (P-type)
MSHTATSISRAVASAAWIPPPRGARHERLRSPLVGPLPDGRVHAESGDNFQHDVGSALTVPIEAGPVRETYASALVRRGEAVAEVTVTGTRTKFGRTAELKT